LLNTISRIVLVFALFCYLYNMFSQLPFKYWFLRLLGFSLCTLHHFLVGCVRDWPFKKHHHFLLDGQCVLRE